MMKQKQSRKGELFSDWCFEAQAIMYKNWPEYIGDGQRFHDDGFSGFEEYRVID